MNDSTSAHFSVDTHLFRQLGELLVGRDATALVELIKNAYDADATEFVLFGEELASPSRAVFRLVDNGVGMTESQYRSGFLRIAARTKTEGERRSVVYHRRYTGEKGVGRLAAHKIAASVNITSVSLADIDGRPLIPLLVRERPNITMDALEGHQPTNRYVQVVAEMNWDVIESFETLDQITDGLSVQSRRLTTAAPLGTTIELRELRHPWTGLELGELLRQLSNFEPPALLTKRLPRNVVREPVLFDAPHVRDAARQDPGMKVKLAGDLARSDEYWGDISRSAEWVLEVNATAESTRYSLAPTEFGREENPFAQPFDAVAPHPAPGLRRVPDLPSFMQYAVVARYLRRL